MASLQHVFSGGFDAATVAPDQGRDFEPLPAGAYDVEISNAEVKDAKSGTGCYLSLELTVIGPTGAGRKVWSNITLKNANAQAESIGQAQLSSLCRAVGVDRLTDSDQLFQKTLRARLRVTPPKDGYGAKNEVTAYETAGAAAPVAPARTAASTAPARAAATPPWAKK